MSFKLTPAIPPSPLAPDSPVAPTYRPFRLLIPPSALELFLSFFSFFDFVGDSSPFFSDFADLTTDSSSSFTDSFSASGFSALSGASLAYFFDFDLDLELFFSLLTDFTTLAWAGYSGSSPV